VVNKIDRTNVEFSKSHAKVYDENKSKSNASLLFNLKTKKPIMHISYRAF